MLRLRGERGRRQAALGDGEDWRDFRARLVSQEQRGAGFESEKGWAYQTDLLEQGSLILSVPGDYWSIRRQYFCKVVMLVITHTPQFTAALVLNRPTGMTLKDVRLEDAGASFGSQPWQSLLKLAGLAPQDDDWQVWFGGDCEGIEVDDGFAKLFCLHTLEKLADKSQRIIRGIFLIDFENARDVVSRGDASRDDFMLIVGYTGWGPGQLQGELDRGGAWILGAADQGLLLGSGAGDDQQSLSSRLLAACERRAPAPAGLADGIHHWNQLFEALRPQEFAALDPEEEGHNDEMIRRWVDLYLVPDRDEAAEQATPKEGKSLLAGTLLRGSATKWILGRPSKSWPSRKRADPWQVPGQYLHKSVLLLDAECDPRRGARMVLLNGPMIGRLGDGREVGFGGMEECHSGNIVCLPGGSPIAGRLTLPPGVLHELLRQGALEVVEGREPGDVWRSRPELMWQAAGGRLDSLAETAMALQGDRQQRKWYRAMLGLDVRAADE